MKFRFTYANVVSTVALVAALGGGGAAVAAGLAKDSVGSLQIKNGAVQARDLAKGSVNSIRVQDNRLTGADIREGTLGRVPRAKLADNILVAAIESTGALVKDVSRFATRSVRLADGIYEVTFDRNISGCAHLSSLARHDAEGAGPQGTVSAAIVADDPRSLFVKTYGTDGFTSVDNSFTAIVSC